MATFHDLRTRLFRALSPRDIRVTFRIDRGIAPDIIPIIERLAPGTDEAVTALYAVLPYFRDERPITAIIRGTEISSTRKVRASIAARSSILSADSYSSTGSAGSTLGLSIPPPCMVACARLSTMRHSAGSASATSSRWRHHAASPASAQSTTTLPGWRWRRLSPRPCRKALQIMSERTGQKPGSERFGSAIRRRSKGTHPTHVCMPQIGHWRGGRCARALASAMWEGAFPPDRERALGALREARP